MTVTSHRRSSVFARGLLVAAALAALSACSEEKKAEAPEVVRPVKVAEIGPPDEGRKLVYSGSVKARTEMNLGFRVSGKITERLVDVGDRVKAGDVLARIDETDYKLSLDSADANLASAQKQAEITQIALKRAQTLRDKNVSSQADLDQATLSRDQAIAAQHSAEASLDQAKNQVAYTELKADRPGIVTAVSADVGQVVASGSAVLTVAVDGSKEVLVAVPEMDVAQFKPGKAVKANFWSSDNLALDGKVREVAGSADSQSRTFAVRVALPDDDRVLLGMTATITASLDNSSPAYSVPLAALAKKGEQSIVWVVDRQKGTVNARSVTIADFSDDGVRISKGLSTGDLVVSAGTQFMKDDMKVRLPETVTSRFGSVNSMTAASVGVSAGN
ncbi:efflux RND transporter periplasmic adaptor subunit [Neorhizobium sp. NCHU2750]|uniref:efflux RND transporter periplasmic adaptor subunit n=1 Tax=Neorhizobium sp. NCHU2750 TaxID=1825976 RepID=UPI000E742348|nr:hemolysin secretion protein D [Neorhizobium sp. NCHU2750]